MIGDTKRRNKGLNLVWPDLSKTFNTVPHSCIFRALRRKGVPESFIEIVCDLYEGCETAISCGGRSTAKIQMLSGVKEGCPLSLLLFNYVVDEFLDSLTETGYKFEVVRINGLAFADDLNLSHSTP